MAASCAGSSRQSLFVIVVNPVGPCNSRTGSASTLGTPACASDGPMARRRRCLAAVPVMMKPPMPTLSPVWARKRVERLRDWAAGVGTGVRVPAGVGEAVPAGVGVIAGVGEGVTGGVGVVTGVGEGVPAGVGVVTGVGEGVPGGVGVVTGVGDGVPGGVGVVTGVGEGVPGGVGVVTGV